VSRRLQVLLVGAGRAGLVHGRNLAAGVPGARLAAVADPEPDARARAAAELGCGEANGDPLEAAADDRFDAVIIASPTFTHSGLAVAALRAHKHVLCEKPLASSLAEGREIMQAAEGSRGVFVMGFMRRFDPSFRRAAQRIAKGEIGEPVLVRSVTRGPGLPPEWAWDASRSGGLIAEVNSHDLDSLRWLSGRSLRSAFAVGLAVKRPDIARRYPGFVDVVAAVFELGESCIGELDGACPAGYGYDARAEVYGTDGMVMVGTPAAGSALLVRQDGVVADSVSGWRHLFADAYRAEDSHFVAAARGEEEPATSVDDGYRALQGVVAVNESLRTGARVEILGDQQGTAPSAGGGGPTTPGGAEGTAPSAGGGGPTTPGGAGR
jgi:predicted dehydrogenase